MFKEFKTFIMRGNVVELAVGIIIGAAFNKIVTSLVADIITPIISFITISLFGSASMDGIVIVLREGAEMKIGLFLMYIIDFLITAISVFLIVKLFNKLNATADKIKKKNGEEKEAEAK